MDARRVVITGTGTVNPLAHTTAETWKKVRAGESGIRRITKFDPGTFTSQVAGEVRDFDYRDHFSEKTLKTAKRMDPFVHYAAAAMREALAESGLDPAAEGEHAGICVGSGIGGVYAQFENAKALVERGHRRVSPFYVPAGIGNIAAGLLSIEFGVIGPNVGLQTACATANHALAMGFLIIKQGMAEAVVTGGAEATITELSVAGFANMHALSTKYNDTPEKASRPYDADRDGFVIAEGAGVLIIEELGHALRRGAPILCEVLSVGMSGDAHDLVIPEPEGHGAYRSMRMAVDQAGIDPSEIDYVNTHGTATPLGDVAEAKAVYRLLDGKQGNVSVGSTKCMHGHLLGATAALEAIICVNAIRDGFVPANTNIERLDPDVPLSCIPTSPVEKKVTVALSNSFGFGGHNSTLVLRAYND